MEKLFAKATIASLLAAMAITTVACPGEKKDDTVLLAAAVLATQDSGTSGDITGAVTWSGEVTLSGPTYVKSGAVLTVDAGTTIKGKDGSYLFFLPGSTLYAVGTEANPIVFTSSNDAGSRQPGDWGGLLFVGNGDISESGAKETEGDDPQPYPGDESINIAMKYVRVEFAGSIVGEGDELNGISMYAVPSTGTAGVGNLISYVQVHMGLDDGIEIFGGDVDLSNILITGSDDDGLDLDMGYKGTVSYLIVEQFSADDVVVDSEDPNGFEWDGGKDGAKTAANASAPTVTNFIVIGGNQKGGYGMKAREGIDISNVSTGLIYGFEGIMKLDNGDNETCPVGPVGDIDVDSTSVSQDNCPAVNTSALVLSTEKVKKSASDADYKAADVDYTTDGGTFTFDFTGTWNDYSLN